MYRYLHSEDKIDIFTRYVFSTVGKSLYLKVSIKNKSFVKQTMLLRKYVLIQSWHFSSNHAVYMKKKSISVL